jgi:hypothetical protein
MNEFKIEKGIPLAPKRTGSELKHPFHLMELNDSVLVKTKKSTNLFQYAVRKYGYKFAQRKIDDNHVRVWRIK